MTITINTYVGQSVGIVFLATTGITTFSDLKLFTDSASGVPVGSMSLVISNAGLSTPAEVIAGSGIYSVKFTPTSNGEYYIYAAGQLIAHVGVAARDVLSAIKNLEDEALGSWSWDKVAGTLVMVGQSGNTLANFSVVDTITASSRERLS